ncbi:excinuclease ATPase subunit [Ideonella azotifigens]|uniref:Phosphoribosylglycinamide formyltransferase n=1 Tax=Ideonella azotifigens TaxID=513160 RepID=A0ABP3VN60_9BURK|nr:excinuclease ATPase subunit [Ideonella azotifigens]MCD2338803.1 excinuclease ATPase subunit [Ideonella azotifigens]
MKKTGRLAFATLALLAGMPLAQARDSILNIPLEEVLALPEAKTKLDGSVKFYLKGQATPAVTRRMGSDVSNPKTNGFGKSDEFGCKWAILTALINFQASAKREGANAVVDIVSYYKKNETQSPTTIECHAGALIIGAALKGDYAIIKD